MENPTLVEKDPQQLNPLEEQILAALKVANETHTVQQLDFISNSATFYIIATPAGKYGVFLYKAYAKKVYFECKADPTLDPSVYSIPA